MTRREQKEEELVVFNELKAIVPHFPTAEQSECPDFLAETSAGTLGIELECYIRKQNPGASDDDNPRQYDQFRKQVQAETQAKFERMCHPPVLATFFWFSYDLIQSRKKTNPTWYRTRPAELASQAADLMCRSLSGLGPEVNRIRIPHVEMPQSLRGYLHCIDMWIWPGLERTEWSAVDSGRVTVAPQELERLIAYKDQAKLNEYLKHCQSCWLVIYADGKHISSTALISPELPAYRFNTRFSRVLFYYDRYEHRYLDLLIGNRGSS